MTPDERIAGQLNAFIILGMLVGAREDMKQELLIYRARCVAQTPMRDLIADSCRMGLPARTAMRLLNTTVELERTV